MSGSWMGHVAAVAVALTVIGCGDKGVETGTEATDDAPISAAFELSPSVGGLGTELDVRIHADSAAFEFGESALDLGPGITVGAVVVLDGYDALAHVTIAEDAELGLRDAVVTIRGNVTTIGGAFEVISESFTVDPDNAKLGEMVEVALVGKNTQWEDGYTWASFGDDANVVDFAVLSNTLAVATVAIPPDGSPGPQDVSVEDGPHVITLYDGFNIDRAAVTAFFDPPEAYQGATVAFTVTGLGTNFAASTALEFWDDGGKNSDISVLELTVLDGENLFGRLQLSNAAKIGYRDVYVSSGDESVLLPEAFSVLDAPPDLSNVAVGIGFDIYRGIDPGNGAVSELVDGFAYFIIPLDPPCGSGSPPGDGPQPYDVNGVFVSPEDSGSNNEDCPAPETVSAGDYVWFESDVNTVTLHKDVIESTGQIIYLGQGLTVNDYRFGHTYDLHTQGDPDGIPEVTLEGVQPTVPADFAMVEPDFVDTVVPRTESFTYYWTPAMTYPTAIFVTSISGTLTTGDSGFAGCVPWDDGVHTYTPAELLMMEPGPVSFSAYSYIEGPEFGLPFSTIQNNQSDSIVAVSASLTLQ
jgi:hypothetical protein